MALDGFLSKFGSIMSTFQPMLGLWSISEGVVGTGRLQRLGGRGGVGSAGSLVTLQCRGTSLLFIHTLINLCLTSEFPQLQR